MPRTLGIIKTAIWTDEDWRALTRDEQRAYVLLLSQPQISNCGVLPYTLRKWAKLAIDDSPATLGRALQTLEQTRFVVIDEDTEEVLVRTFIKHDKIEAQPRLLEAAKREFREIESVAIRGILRAEYPQIFAEIRDLRPPGQGVLEGVRQGVPEGVGEGVNARARGGARAGAQGVRAPADAPSPSPTPSPSPDALGNSAVPVARAGEAGPEEGLPFEKELAVSKLLERIGADADAETPAVVRHFAARVSIASIEKVAESLTGAGARDRAAYVVGGLKRELGEQPPQRQPEIEPEPILEPRG